MSSSLALHNRSRYQHLPREAHRRSDFQRLALAALDRNSYSDRFRRVCSAACDVPSRRVHRISAPRSDLHERFRCQTQSPHRMDCFSYSSSLSRIQRRCALEKRRVSERLSSISSYFGSGVCGKPSILIMSVWRSNTSEATLAIVMVEVLAGRVNRLQKRCHPAIIFRLPR